MDLDFIEKMKVELLKKKEILIAEIQEHNKDSQETLGNHEPKDEVDIASDDIDLKNLQALNKLHAKELNLIDQALSRMANNKYGLCLSCHNKIQKERLQAIPYAFLCINCQTKLENK